MTEFIKISSDMVQYNIENSKKVNEHFASLLLNPYVTWAKFILTDDEPNGNGVRIPEEEFDNLIDSGVYMPIKMEVGKVGNHQASIPIGVITHLQKVKNRIEGLAALWQAERPEDVDLLKEMKDNEETLNISWEVGYSVTTDSPDHEGVMDLYNTVLKAATLVETPAYEGRTTILALAEQEKNNMEELKERITELEESLSVLQEENKELKEKLDGSTASTDELMSELTELREFKAGIEAEAEKAEKLADIQKKFVEAGIEKEEEYFGENSDTLLSLDESSLAFFIQELVAFGKAIQEAEAEEDEDDEEEEVDEESASKAPPLFGEDGEIDTSSLAHILKYGEPKDK